MLWNVEDNGKVFIQLHSTGMGAQMLTKDAVNRYVANIVSDLATTQGIDIITNELRIRFHKDRPEVTVFWRSQVPVEQVADVREYMVRMSQDAPGE